MSNKTMTGSIVSKSNKTVAVEIERQYRHPLYQKTLKVHHKILAHDEDEVGMLGDVVEISETRPISRRKSWKLVRVVK